MKKLLLTTLVVGVAVIANLQSADPAPSSKPGCCAIQAAPSCPTQAACPADAKANCAKAGDCAQCECKQCTCTDCKDCTDCKACCAAKTAKAACPMAKATAGACAAKATGVAAVKGGPKLLKINLPVSSGCCPGTGAAQMATAGKCPMSGTTAQGTMAQTAPAK